MRILFEAINGIHHTRRAGERETMTMQTSAVPVFCVSCLDEIEMPCTYVIRPGKGCYHLGCHPPTWDCEIATANGEDAGAKK